MPENVLIHLGGGIGGVVAANTLRKALPRWHQLLEQQILRRWL